VRLGATLIIVSGIVFIAWGLLGGGTFVLMAGAVFLTIGAAWATLNRRRF
jgi:hypothetical protein